MTERPPNEAQIEYIQANASNQREYEALMRLQKDFEVARLRTVREEREMEKAAQEENKLKDEDEFDEDDEYEEDEEPDAQFDMELSSNRSRLHEYTIDGHFRTKPRSLLLPTDQFIEPIAELLRRTDKKHISLAAEKALGGKGLPHGPATPSFAKSFPQRGLGLEAGHHRMSEIQADAFLGTSMPGIYASVMGTLVEVRKRLGPEWMRGLLNRKAGDDVGPRVLDSGAGGAGMVAWNEVIQTEWDLMREKDADLGATPPGKKSVVVGSNNLRHRISRFWDDTQFLPRLPQYSFVENSDKQLDAPEVQQKRKVYDVIISAHTLLPIDREYKRRDMLENLWSLLSPDGGVLIVLEKGHPRGFEAVAEVRQRLLDEFIIAPTTRPRTESTEPEELPRVREPGMIIAPCTNHVKCPMYQTSGVSPGRKDFCHFSQRFTRPQFLQRVLGESSKNHEDINYSFIAIRRGMPAAVTTADGTNITADSQASATATPIPQGETATLAALKGYESTPTNSPTRPHPLALPRNILPPNQEQRPRHARPLHPLRLHRAVGGAQVLQPAGLPRRAQDPLGRPVGARRKDARAAPGAPRPRVQGGRGGTQRWRYSGSARGDDERPGADEEGQAWAGRATGQEAEAEGGADGADCGGRVCGEGDWCSGGVGLNGGQRAGESRRRDMNKLRLEEDD